jgi:hypothetical protein
MKLVVEFDIKGLIITDGNNNELVRETSQVPSYRGKDDIFNRLRELAKDEWITKCFYKIDGVLQDKIREGIKFKEEKE